MARVTERCTAFPDLHARGDHPVMEGRHNNFDAVVDNDPIPPEHVLLTRTSRRAPPRRMREPLAEAVGPDHAERRGQSTLEEAPPGELHHTAAD
ncbi:MAG: hypothetical protein ACJ76U_05895 [Gaiellaceae bacterium]